MNITDLPESFPGAEVYIICKNRKENRDLILNR